jgi:hypothetical protein
MTTIIEKPPTRMAIAKYLKTADNLLTYRNWMIEVIKRHAKPGQKVLVVCKKVLTGPDGLKYFPAWEHSDKRWREVNYTTAFGYDLDGINVSVQWWGGPSTGHNAWQDADVVFLFDANWTPRHKVLADMQGLQRQTADKIEMTSLRKQSDQFKDYRLRCRMRDHVQAACRGKLRHWSNLAVFSVAPVESALTQEARSTGSTGLEGLTGVNSTAIASTTPLVIPECSNQLLVCGISDDAWLFENWAEMFPLAPLPIYANHKPMAAKKGYKQDWAERLRSTLAQPNPPDRVSTKWIGEQWGVEWRKVSHHALKALSALASQWRYEPGRGRAPGYFVAV